MSPNYAIHTQWKGSGGHWSILTSGNYSKIGCARVKGSASNALSGKTGYFYCCRLQ